MTKIKKQQHKRLNFPQQEIRHLREALENGPVDTLAGTLQEYSEWRFVRGDMYHWIKVLNRFDEILADVCSKYNLSVPQARAFDSGTQKLLVAILSFSCLLLENCINRNLYSSTDRLDHLLNTSDHAVLECTLRILVRTAQRWSYQRDLKTSMISMSGRLTTIADSWHAKNDIVPFIGSGTPESLASHTNEFRLLAQEKNTELLQSHAGIVHYQFFRTAEEACRLDALRTQQPATTTTTPATTAGQGEPSATELRRKTSGSHRKTPAGKKAAGASGRAASIEAEGLVCIDVPVRDLNIDASLPVVDQMMLVFDRLVERFKVPASCHFELRFRIYVALAMATGDSSLRYSLLRSRIYAATIFTSLLSEQEFKNMFLSREPNYTCDIIGILQPEVNAPLSVQTAALIGLEGVMRQRGEVSGAYAALNASANHGVLMFILRKAFAHAHEPPVFPQDFMNALFNFITGMIGSMNGGQLLVSAGIVPVFVSALKHDHPLQRRGVSRVAKLLDSLITSANSAFAAFCSANGIAVLVQRMHSEVASAVAISDASPDVANDQSCPVELARYPNYPEQIYRRRELLTAEHTLLLKELFKFMSRMLQQTSHQDRLRNLIETTLPQTLVSVLSHPVVFGNNVYGQCVLISATLVHNEPTSLPVIQEANLPQTFLAQLEKHIPYSGDVIQYIPTALGAFCLNEAGMEQFKQSTIIERLLSIFSEPDFARILQEGDIPGTLGSAIDELMRHFPSIKGSIMDQVIIMLKQVVKVGEADSPLRAIDPGNTFLLRSAKEEDVKPYLEDYYAMMLESATTFLEGLLEQRAQGELFMERGGWDLVVRAIRSPLLPFDFVKSRAYRSLNGLSSTLLDTTHEAVFKALFVQLKECLQLPLIVNDVDHAHVDPAGYVALTDPTGLSEEELSVAHTRIHNTISATTVTALITYLINGSGGGSLARSLHASTEFISSDELVWTLGEVCRCYCSSVRKAVAIAHVTATFAESDDEKTAKAGDQDASRMDVDSEKAASSSIVPFVKSNYLSLSETAIAFTIHAADFIECMSNSLNVTVGGPSSQPKLGNQLAHELNDFVNSLLEVCGSAERTVAGAQLIDQTTAVMMKTLVFVRHRIYLKLRIFLQFVESQGLGKFCALLEAMWQWAESLPPVPAPETSKDGVPSPAKADPHAKLRQVLENVLDSLLSILSFMSDGEPLAECPEITALMREHTNQQTWFRPSDVLVHVRTKVLSTLSMLWQSPLLIQGSANIAQSFTACLGPIISAQHEQRTSSSATSSAPGSQLSFRPGMPNYIDRRRLGQTPDGMPALRPPLSTTMAMLSRTIGGIERASPLSQSNIPFMPPHPIQPTPARPHAVVPNPERVGDLMAMGFSREDAEAALRRNLNSLARAANDLLAREAEAEDRGEESAEDNAEESDADANADADAASEAMDDAHEEQRETEPAAEVSESEPMAVDDAAPSAEAAPAAAAEEAAPPAEPSATEEQPALPAPTVEGIAPFNDDGWRSKRVADEDADRELLGELRASIRDSIAPRAIELLGEFGEQAVMRLRGILELVMRKNDSGTIVHILLNAFTPLLSQVTAEGSDETSSLDKQLAAHAHLWAVLVSTPTLLDEMYPQIGKLASHLIRALDVASRRKDRSPVWLTAALLLTEQLIQRDDEPPNTKLETKEDFQRIAKRGLTKLPPSSAPIEPVGTPVAGSSRSPLVRELIAEPLTTSPEESAVVDMAGDHSPAIVPAQSAGGAEPKESTPERQPIFDSASRLELQRLCAQFFTQPMPTYAPPVLNALLRLIVILTRTPEFATRFFLDGHLASVTRAMRTIAPGDLPGIAATVSKDATPLVFVNAIMSVSKEQSRDLRQERTLVMHVLRHTVESRPVLKLLMENLIHGWFESPQFSSTDANAYARGTVAYSLRNPEVFNEVSAERCYLPHYSEDLRVNWMALAWRSEKLIDEDEIDMYEASPLVDNDGTVVEENSATSGQPGADAKAKTVEFEKFLEDKKAQAPFKPYTLDAESERLACSVAEFLASEILTLRPAAIPLPSAVDMQAAAKPVRPTVSPLSGPAVPSTDDCSPDTVAYRCFLIQCLAEMVASFPFTMQAIFVARSGHLLSAPPSRTKDSSKGKMRASAAAAPASTGASADGPVQQSVLRVRSPLISHLVHDLIVREALNSTKGAKMRTRPEDLATMGTEEEQALAIASQQIKVKRSQLSRCVTFWATALLSTICVRHHEGWTTTINASPRAVGTEDITLESLHGSYDAALSAARQLVLDHIVRAFRECLSMRMAGIGGADVVYARLTSLAQLTYKLVIARSINHGVPGSARTAGTNSNGDRNGSERENANALKKMILERGILDLLTAASSRLNLNYPQSREMLNNFLRPIELLSKAAVKISREAVLSAWEQSGQEKMPLNADQRGFAVDLFYDDDVHNNSTTDADDDVPPDLYQNSALGLYQNQRTGGRDLNADYDDELMEEDFDEDMYDEGNSSVSDIDTEDEEMVDNIVLDQSITDEVHNVDGNSDLDMEMDTIMREGEDDEDDDDDEDIDDDDDNGSIDSEDVDEIIDDDIDETAITPGEAISLTLEEDDGALFGSEFDADIADTENEDTDGD
ncbi:E3 ubiquitin-protein ligase tom1, partial [Linderina macrospora]